MPQGALRGIYTSANPRLRLLHYALSVTRLRRLSIPVSVALAGAVALVACGSGGSDAGAARPLTQAQAAGINSEVVATVQTAPVPNSGDAADDAAIWVDADDPSRSTVIGTDKQGGLLVYDLAGRVLHDVPGGKPNNVDLRDGFALAGENVALVAASDRDGSLLDLYRVDPATRDLIDVAARRIELSIAAYGLCMYHSPKTGRFFVFVNSKKGEVEQWQLLRSTARKGKVDARRVRAFDVGTQTEGCVADDGLRRLYVGEEDVGIWRYGAEPDAGGSRTKVDSTGGEGHLEADVEGLAIAHGQDGRGWLIASSQGSSSYTLYARNGSNGYVGSFEIVAGNGIGAVQQTDGIDVTTAGLGPAFPHGVFVAQDGKNDGEHQNFKLVPWDAIVGS